MVKIMTTRNENLYNLMMTIKEAATKYNDEEIKAGRRHEATSINDYLEHLEYIAVNVSNMSDEMILKNMDEVTDDLFYELKDII